MVAAPHKGGQWDVGVARLSFIVGHKGLAAFRRQWYYYPSVIVHGLT
jgi:hypothetical protein